MVESERLRRIISQARVISLERQELLRFFVDLHGEDITLPQRLVIIAQSLLKIADRLQLAVVLDFQVECCLVGEVYILQGSYGLVVFVDIHRRHVVRADILGSQGIVARQHVHIFDIKLTDALTLVIDASRVVHADAWHSLQYILDASILFFLEGIDIISQGVAALADRHTSHHHLLDIDSLIVQGDVLELSKVLSQDGLRLVAQPRQGDTGDRIMGGGGKTEFTLSIRLRITLQLLMLIVGSDHYIAKSFARLVPYHSRKGGLGRERQGY